jgi:hypothetical protein
MHPVLVVLLPLQEVLLLQEVQLLPSEMLQDVLLLPSEMGIVQTRVI